MERPRRPTSRRRPKQGYRDGRAGRGRRPGALGPRPGRQRRRCLGDGRWRWLAGRGHDLPPSTISRTPASGGNPQPLRPRPRGRPRRRRRRSRRLYRRWRAPRRPGRDQRPRLRQQRLAGAIRGGGPAERATAMRSCEPCSTRCRSARAGGAVASTCAGPGRMVPTIRRGRSSWFPTIGTGSGVPSAREPARGWTRACSESRWHPVGGGGRVGGATRGSGRPPSSRSTQTPPSPPESTVRR